MDVCARQPPDFGIPRKLSQGYRQAEPSQTIEDAVLSTELWETAVTLLFIVADSMFWKNG
jgi:hypothetical protein